MPKPRATNHNHCFIYPLKHEEGHPYAWKLDIQPRAKAISTSSVSPSTEVKTRRWRQPRTCVNNW